MFSNTMKGSKENKGNAMRGKRQLEFTCLDIVIKRLMAELKLNLQQLAEGSGVPYTTLYDWTNGVIPNNPDQLRKLKNYFNQKLPNRVTVDYLLFGNDQDQEELKKKIAELEKRNQELESIKAAQGADISFMQWMIDEEKKKNEDLKKIIEEKKEAKDETQSA